MNTASTCIFGPVIGRLLELQAELQNLARTTGAPSERLLAKLELGGTPRPATPIKGTVGFPGIGLEDLSSDHLDEDALRAIAQLERAGIL